MYRSPTRSFRPNLPLILLRDLSRSFCFFLVARYTLATSSFLFLPLVGWSRVVSSRNLERYLLDDLEQRRERASRFTSTYEMLRGARKLGRIVPDHDRIRRSTVPEPSAKYRPPVVTSYALASSRKSTGNGRGRTVAPEPQQPATHDPTDSLFSFPTTSHPFANPSQTPRKTPLLSSLLSLSSSTPDLSFLLLSSPLNPSASYPLLSNTPRRCSPHLASPLCHAFQHHPTLFASPPSHCALAFLLTSCRIALPRFTSPLLSADHCHSLLQPPVLFCPLSLPLHGYICTHTRTHTYTNARWSTRERNLFRIRQRPIPTCFPFFHLRCSYQQFLSDLPLS